MESNSSKTIETATKCGKNTLIFTFVVVTFLTTFTSCTKDEIPMEKKVLNSNTVDIEPRPTLPSIPILPPTDKK